MRQCAWLMLFLMLCSGPAAHAGVLLATELVLEDHPEVTGMTHAPGDCTRLFILQRSGRIWIIKDGALLEKPFLDITGQVSVSGERGLLSAAFHPDYQSNGHFFIRYNRSSGDTIIKRFTVSQSDPDIADSSSAQDVLTIDNQSPNHNGGWTEFGPDGMLYVSVGNDTDSDASQDLDDLHGKILRLDVNGDDFPGDDERNYAIPRDNPLVNDSGAPEVWAWGMRNPWQCAIDHVSQRIWISDVGDFDYEELSVEPLFPSSIHRNLGYACMEGLHCTPDPICDCDDPSLIMPLHEYSHGQGCAVIGGRVYRGCAIPELAGSYFCADYCSGIIWSMQLEDGRIIDVTERQEELTDPDGDSINLITSFGEDALGELYLCTLSGSVYKIVPATPPVDANGDGIPDSCAQGTPGDVNGDSVVDVNDLLLIIMQWGPCDVPGSCAADVIVDGTVDVNDLLNVIFNWT